MSQTGSYSSVRVLCVEPDNGGSPFFRPVTVIGFRVEVQESAGTLRTDIESYDDQYAGVALPMDRGGEVPRLGFLSERA